MDVFIQQLISGVSVGGTYALVALGFVLIFGVANILNIAQAEIVMLAPMAVIVAHDLFGVGAMTGFAIALVVTLIAGLAIHLIGVQPFLSRTSRGLETDLLAPLIGTFGLGLVIQHTVSALLGSNARPFPFSVRLDVWRVGTIAIDPMHLVSLGIAGTLMAALVIVINRTGFGRSMRAVAENPAVAATLGISVRATTYLTTGAAALLGAVAGLLFATATNSVSPFMGLSYGLKGLVVMIVGGVTSVPGAVIAGLILGVIEAMVTGFISSSYRDVLSFALLVAVLLVRPEGLFSAASREGRP